MTFPFSLGIIPSSVKADKDSIAQFGTSLTSLNTVIDVFLSAPIILLIITAASAVEIVPLGFI